MLWTRTTSYAYDTDQGTETTAKTVTTIIGRMLNNRERLGRPGVGRDGQPLSEVAVFSGGQFTDTLPSSGDTIKDGTKEYVVDDSSSNEVAGLTMTVHVNLRGPR
jgi:hypothetical protein